MNNRKTMKSQKELEIELYKYQDLYDKYENNPIKQTDAAVKIADCIRQLRLWDDLYNTTK